MKNYHHPACIFETFKKARPSTKVKKSCCVPFFSSQIGPQIIEDPTDLEGWSEVAAEDRKTVLALIDQVQQVDGMSSLKVEM